jgi:DNA-binding beta-propeller fold protein YncE
MAITTPAVAQTIDSLSNTQKETIQDNLQVDAFIAVASSVKAGTDHVLTVKTLTDGFAYLFKNDDIIEQGDTLSDVDTNSFDIVFKGCDYIPANWWVSVIIEGTDAIVSRFIAFDEINGDFLTKFAPVGISAGQVDGARGMFAKNGFLYVVDSLNNRISIFDINGNYISQFGGFGSGNGLFTQPEDVAVNDSNIFVTDSANDRVQIFDLDGTYVDQFGGTGSGDGLMDSPKGIDIDEDYVYVADQGNSRVQVFDLSGTYVSQFSGGGGIQAVSTALGLAVSKDYVVITDNANNYLKIYTKSGTYVTAITLAGAKGVDVTEGLIYAVSETLADKVRVYDYNLNLLRVFGGLLTVNADPGLFTSPYGVAINEASLFVSDNNNANDDDNIHKFI